MGNIRFIGAVENRNMTYEGQRVIFGDGLTASYDNVGNMTQKVMGKADNSNIHTWDYDFDGEGRLYAITYDQAAQPYLEMAYDHTGQRIKKRYRKPDGSYSTTYYIGDRFEIRKLPWGQREITTYVQAGTHGKLAAYTTQTNEYITKVWESNRNWEYAGLFGWTSLKGISGKLHYSRLALTQHPDFWPRFLRYILLPAFFLLMVLVLFVLWYLSRGMWSERSQFSRAQRWTALAISLVFLTATSCKEIPLDSQQDQSVQEIALDGETVQGRALDGDTTQGLGGTSAQFVDHWVYFHPNHVSSNSTMTDDQGAVVTRIHYLPFGEIDQTHSAGEEVTNYKFTGQELDEESDPEGYNDLMYYNARYYDPAIGRFLSADSIVPDPKNAQAHNRYTYVYNSPIKYADPTGHEPEFFKYIPNIRPLFPWGNTVGIGGSFTASIGPFGGTIGAQAVADKKGIDAHVTIGYGAVINTSKFGFASTIDATFTSAEKSELLKGGGSSSGASYYGPTGLGGGAEFVSDVLLSDVITEAKDVLTGKKENFNPDINIGGLTLSAGVGTPGAGINFFQTQTWSLYKVFNVKNGNRNTFVNESLQSNTEKQTSPSDEDSDEDSSWW